MYKFIFCLSSSALPLLLNENCETHFKTVHHMYNAYTLVHTYDVTVYSIILVIAVCLAQQGP